MQAHSAASVDGNGNAAATSSVYESWPPCDRLRTLLKRAAPVKEVLTCAHARQPRNGSAAIWQRELADALQSALPNNSPPGYQKQLVRRAMSVAEQESPSGHVDDRLADEMVTAFVPATAPVRQADAAEMRAAMSPSSSSSAWSSDEPAASRSHLAVKHFCYGLSECHDVHMLCSDNLLQDGTGSCLWDAGIVLAECILSRPELVQGKRVLELGAGLGLAGVCT